MPPDDAPTEALPATKQDIATEAQTIAAKVATEANRVADEAKVDRARVAEDAVRHAEEAKRAAEAAKHAAERAYQLAYKTEKTLTDLGNKMDRRFTLAESERTEFYSEQRTNFTEFTRQTNDGMYAIRQQLMDIDKTGRETFAQACETNGSVKTLKRDMYGPDGKGGVMGDRDSLMDSRKYITIGASILFAIYSIFWGPDHFRNWLAGAKQPAPVSTQVQPPHSR